MFSGAFQLPIPTLEYHADGRDIGQIAGFVGRLRRSGVSMTGPASYRTNSFGGSIGLTFGSTSLNYFARGYEEFIPSGSDFDGYGLALEGYRFSHGDQVKAGTGRISWGATAKFVSAYYDHKRLSSDGLTKGAEVAGVPSATKSGFGLDAGVVYQPDLGRDLYWALSVDNLVPAAIRFDRQLSDGSIHPGGIEPFRTAVHVGFAREVNSRTWVAMDALDLTNSLGRRQLAVGLEHGLNRYLVLQLGYNSRTSFSIGVSILGITARLAGRQPLSIESGIKF